MEQPDDARPGEPAEVVAGTVLGLEHLIVAANAARKNAYCPYSGYAVGAAIEDADGNIWTGANLENASYGLTICAERAAIATMASAGKRRIRRVVVATENGGPPCGMCLQTMLEFAPQPDAVEVGLVSATGELSIFTLQDLIPFGFRPDDLNRTEPPVR